MLPQTIVSRSETCPLRIKQFRTKHNMCSCFKVPQLHVQQWCLSNGTSLSMTKQHCQIRSIAHRCIHPPSQNLGNSIPLDEGRKNWLRRVPNQFKGGTSNHTTIQSIESLQIPTKRTVSNNNLSVTRKKKRSSTHHACHHPALRQVKMPAS